MAYEILEPRRLLSAGDAVPTVAVVVETFGATPLTFEPLGAFENSPDPGTQASGSFISRGFGYRYGFSSTEVTMAILDRSDSTDAEELNLSMHWVGAADQIALSGVDQTTQKSNYLFGSDPSLWRTDVSHFERLRYDEVYEGMKRSAREN